jgi:hypothetical protein
VTVPLAQDPASSRLGPGVETAPPDVPAPLRRLLAGAVDYAGLFPPAGQSIEEALHSYAAYRRGPASWMLGRFVVGTASLEEFARCASRRDASDMSPPWGVALVGVAAGAVRQAVEFACSLAGEGRRWAVDAVEVAPCQADAVVAAAAAAPAGLSLAFEVAIGAGLVDVVHAVGRVGGTVKVRTGGLVPSAVPATADLARVVTLCATSGIALKATAGLHHPVRSEHPLTYEAGAPRAMVHGFVNVFVASALALAAAGRGQAVEDVQALVKAVLDETDARAFRTEGDAVAWRGERAGVTPGTRAFITSFGSCSFAEPVDELSALGWLEQGKRS